MRFLRWVFTKQASEIKWGTIDSMIVLVILILSFGNIYPQEKESQLDQYQIGPGEKLMIQVHVWGEVARPGEYLVPDGTNVLELISRAGGPTAFANLKNITLTRKEVPTFSKTASKREEAPYKKHIMRVNLTSYLNNDNSNSLPVLKPGDVVMVKQNTWYKWQTIIKVISQVAIIIQVWYWYSRING